MMAGLMLFLTNRIVAPIVAAVGVLAVAGCLLLYISNSSLRATVAEQKAALAAVQAERDNYKHQADTAAADLAEKDRQRQPRFNQAERTVQNAPSSPVTAHNLAVRDCLLILRGGGTCPTTGILAPAAPTATNR